MTGRPISYSRSHGGDGHGGSNVTGIAHNSHDLEVKDSQIRKDISNSVAIQAYFYQLLNV